MKIIKEAVQPISNSRLNFKSIGFQRDPSNDFSDDGTRFRMYLYKGKLPMSYASHQGNAYIALRPDYMGLRYEQYRKLPSYKDMDKYNGVSISFVNLKDLANIADKVLDEIESMGLMKESILVEKFDNDKYFPKIPSDAKLVKHRGRVFWYDEKNALLHVVFKDEEEIEEVGKANAPWRSSDTVGLRRENWKNKETRMEYLDGYSDDLDEEGAALAADFMKYEYGR